METNEFDQLNKMRQKLMACREQLTESEEKYDALQRKYDELLQQSSYFSNMGKLAAGIAHEIRNPLTTVRGFLQLIKPHLLDVQKDEYADIAIEEIDRANEILFQFLNAFKPIQREHKPIPINKLVREISLLFEGEVRLHDITLQTYLTPDDPSVFVDSSQLKQVIINMVKNAMDAIHFSNRPQGKIALTTEIAGSKVVIRIKDNGCGMTDECMDAIFSPFFTTKTSGTGLGLTISSKIIQEHGGDIRIESKLGEGTTFHIELPSHKEYMLHA